MAVYVKTKKEWKHREWRVPKSGRGYYYYRKSRGWDRKLVKSVDPDGKVRYRYPGVVPQYMKPLKIPIRKQCLDRDGSRCQQCGIQLKRLHVHHVDWLGPSKTRNPNNSLPNLITLCPACHQNSHEAHQEKLIKASNIKDMRDNGMTYQEIGGYFGVSRQRIHQIYSSCY